MVGSQSRWTFPLVRKRRPWSAPWWTSLGRSPECLMPYLPIPQQPWSEKVMRFPPSLKSFVVELKWTFAKTYASTWSHEYVVRSRVDENLFIELVRHIRTYGYEGRF